MIADPALMCHASSAIFLKRFVQSLPRRVENLDAVINEMDLHPVAVEFDFVQPALAARNFVDRGRQRRFNEAGVGRLDPDRCRLFTLKSHD